MEVTHPRDLSPNPTPFRGGYRLGLFGQSESYLSGVRHLDTRLQDLSIKCAVQEQRLAFVEKMLDEHRRRTRQVGVIFSVAVVVAALAILVCTVSG